MGLLKLNKINLLFDMYLEHSPFVSRNLGNLSFSHHIWDLEYKLFRLIFGLFLLFLDLNSITFTTSSTLPVFLRGWDLIEEKMSVQYTLGSRYSRMEKVKFLEDSLYFVLFAMQLNPSDPDIVKQTCR